MQIASCSRIDEWCKMPGNTLNIALCRCMVSFSLLVMVICHTCDACSPPIHWKHQEVSKRAALADIVIVGKVVHSPYRRASRKMQIKERKRGLYAARIRVLCALKGGPLPAYVEVSGFGQVPGHCVHSLALSNVTYVGFLRRRNGSYYVAEVNNQRGMIPFKQRLLQRIVRKVGHGCANISVENHRATKPDVYFDEVPTKRVTPTDRRPPTPYLQHDSNAAFKMRPVWEAPILMVMYFLGRLLT